MYNLLSSFMQKHIIDSLYAHSKHHRDGKWFVPSVAALLQIDGDKKYRPYINDAEELINLVDKELYNRFLGVYNQIEDWVEINKLEPMRRDNTMSFIADTIDPRKLLQKCIDNKEIVYKRIKQYVYVFKP